MPCKKDGTFSFSCQLRQFLFFTLNPVGHQSTNWIVLLVLTLAIAALTSLGTTSPLYNMQHAMYLPCRGSHFTIWLAGSKHAAERKIGSVDDLLWTFHGTTSRLNFYWGWLSKYSLCMNIARGRYFGKFLNPRHWNYHSVMMVYSMCQSQ